MGLLSSAWQPMDPRTTRVLPPAVPSQRGNRPHTVAALASVDGVPAIRFVDTLEIVQHILHATVQAQLGFGSPPGRQQGTIAQLHLESTGLWVFFTEGKVYELRFGPALQRQYRRHPTP